LVQKKKDSALPRKNVAVKSAKRYWAGNNEGGKRDHKGKGTTGDSHKRKKEGIEQLRNGGGGLKITRKNETMMDRPVQWRITGED